MNALSLLGALFSAAIGVQAAAAELQLRETGTFAAPNAAFVDISRFDGDDALIVTSFGFIGNDPIYVVRDVEGFLGGSLRAETLTQTIAWPNQATPAPAAIFGEDSLAVASGFFPIPWKSTGSISVVRTDGTHLTLTRPKTGWWYHHVHWSDMNGDGRLDLVTARANRSLFGGGKGELLWLEQPENPTSGPWQEHVIASGPDVYFDLHDFDRDGQEEIVATEFFAKRLSIYWKNGSSWERQMVDDTLGSAFALEVVDLNADGRVELLVTNHENQASRSAVFAYEIPADARRGEWKRHTLLTGIPTYGGMGQASPGHAISFFPRVDDLGGRPWIVVSGDGARQAYLLRPAATADRPWAYESKVFFKSSGIVGMPAVGDVNDDGYADLFVPAYGEGLVYSFTFAP